MAAPALGNVGRFQTDSNPEASKDHTPVARHDEEVLGQAVLQAVAVVQPGLEALECRDERTEVQVQEHLRVMHG